MIFRPENWTVKKCQERHFSKELVHGFVRKSNFFSFGFFGMIKSEKIFFFIFWIEEKDF